MTYSAYERCYSCAGKAQPGAVNILKFLMNKYPYTKSLGVYNCRYIAGTTTLSNHSCGCAVDLFIPNDGWDKPRTELGNPIVQFLASISSTIGLTEQIYAKVRYSASYPNGKYYGGAHPHHDHIHFSITKAKGVSLTYAQIVAVAGDPNPTTPTGEDQVLDTNSPSPSSAVAMYQRDLIRIGYDLGTFPSIQPSLYPPGADGDFGSATEDSTKAFQASMNIAVTGKADALTVALAANLARFAEHSRTTGGKIAPTTSTSVDQTARDAAAAAKTAAATAQNTANKAQVAANKANASLDKIRAE